jgi:hypothetical protein
MAEVKQYYGPRQLVRSCHECGHQFIIGQTTCQYCHPELQSYEYVTQTNKKSTSKILIARMVVFISVFTSLALFLWGS